MKFYMAVAWTIWAAGTIIFQFTDHSTLGVVLVWMATLPALIDYQEYLEQREQGDNGSV